MDSTTNRERREQGPRRRFERRRRSMFTAWNVRDPAGTTVTVVSRRRTRSPPGYRGHEFHTLECSIPDACHSTVS